LFDQCIEIFPPPHDEVELELLKKLWSEVEKSDPELLPKMLPLVTKFFKRYFQMFKFDETRTIMDLVERHYPALIVTMYDSACDVVLLNIVPSQYAAFVQNLKEFKKRLTKVARIHGKTIFFFD
jgi:hypothetical protein